VRLFFGENVDEFLEIGDTSTSKKLQQFVVAVTWLWNIDKMLSLWPRDAANRTKFIDKCYISINTIQQLNTIDRQLANPSFV